MPDAEYAYEGPDFGVGSKMSWSVTEPRPETGSQTVVASTPYERVDVELELGPQGTAQASLPSPPGERRHQAHLGI